MLAKGSLPSATTWGTWNESVEVWSIDDDTQANLDDVTEVTLYLRDPYTGVVELTLTLGSGDITLPATGIVQWNVEAARMGTLSSKLYEVILLLENDIAKVPLFLGPISII